MPNPGVQPPNPGLTPTFQMPRPLVPGSLIVFHYINWKNDPTPMVIVSRIIPGRMLKGINVHYLAFREVSRLLRIGGGNPSFSYYNIKGNRYISSAFRSYSWGGVDFGTMRVLDVSFLLQAMKMVTSFDPLQIRAIRSEIERQLAQQMNQPHAGPTLLPPGAENQSETPPQI